MVTESIPRRIIQTGKSRDLPPLARGVVANITLLNPDFEYLYFDDGDVERFINAEFPQYRRAFDSFPVRIQKYDFFRYLAVYRYGGFYFDLDVLLTTSLSVLLAEECVFPFERLTWTDFLRDRGMDWEIGNYAFGAAPGHPFLLAAIENCVRGLTDLAWRDEITKPLPRALREDLFVIYTTGPGLVSRTLADYLPGSRPLTVLFPTDVTDRRNWNQFGEHGVHLCQSSWRSSRGFFHGRLFNLLGRRNEERAIALARRAGATRRWPLQNLQTAI